MIEEPQTFKPNKKKIKSFVVNDAILKKIKRLSFVGMTPTQIAEYFGLEWYDWLIKTTEHPEIKTAIMSGKSQGVFEVAEKLFEHIDNNDLRATTFFLETKGGFNKPDPKAKDVEEERDQEKITDRIDGATDQIDSSRIYQDIMTRS